MQRIGDILLLPTVKEFSRVVLVILFLDDVFVFPSYFAILARFNHKSECF